MMASLLRRVQSRNGSSEALQSSSRLGIARVTGRHIVLCHSGLMQRTVKHPMGVVPRIPLVREDYVSL